LEKAQQIERQQWEESLRALEDRLLTSGLGGSRADALAGSSNAKNIAANKQGGNLLNVPGQKLAPVASTPDWGPQSSKETLQDSTGVLYDGNTGGVVLGPDGNPMLNRPLLQPTVQRVGSPGRSGSPISI